ncbi:MAG: sugar porter family MFS transporter, partial [Planctomycetaceae bacterium]|nr:sugar porter family MFS transporter [Planctomycetaceae bacterium]
MQNDTRKLWATRYLLLVAGLGGLLFGIDLGIIAAALPYLESTAAASWHMDAQQLSLVVAAVAIGVMLSSLFAGAASDLFGRRAIMFLSGLLFVVSIPIIALSNGFAPLMIGRVLQGVSGGLAGVVVPLYLAESLPAKNRGRGTAIFQLLLTLGFVVAAMIGLCYAKYVDGVQHATRQLPDAAAQVLIAKNHAWRSIFWASMIPGVFFTVGVLFLSESARWLFRRGKSDAAKAVLLRTRSAEEAALELREMAEIARSARPTARSAADSLLSRKYVLPFVITLIILACTQATGVNSILAYIVNIFNAAGLPGSVGNWGDVAFKVLMCLATVLGMVLVDRKGRKFLLMLGTGGIIVSLVLGGLLFFAAEQGRVNCNAYFQKLVVNDALNVKTVDGQLLQRALTDTRGTRAPRHDRSQQVPMQLTLVCDYGPFTNIQSRRSDEPPQLQLPIAIERSDIVKDDSTVGRAFRNLGLNPFADPAKGRTASLIVRKAMIGPVPSVCHGWL